MAKHLTVQEFFDLFPDDDTCLEHLMMVRYGNPLDCPKCGSVEQSFTKLKKLPAYACPTCGHHIHPMVNTPFERTRTPLQKWFYAMYLFTTSRHGVPAKELQRQLGVTYKTAWRMGHELRKYIAQIDGDTMMGGHVEADETLIGGRVSGKGRGPYAGGNKTVVFGILQRHGDVLTRVVPNVKRKSLLPIIKEFVEPGSYISTDENMAYASLTEEGYRHTAVNHSEGQYVRGWYHTNSIEGFWSRFKNSIRGTHVHVSKKHLQKYLREFEFRHNMRKSPHLMFDILLGGFWRVPS